MLNSSIVFMCILGGGLLGMVAGVAVAKNAFDEEENQQTIKCDVVEIYCDKEKINS